MGQCGNSEFFVGKNNVKSICCQLNDSNYDFKGIEDVLVGKITVFNKFINKRIIVIQFR